MCEEHAAAGISCPSIGAAVRAAPKVAAGVTLSVCAAVALSFMVASILWIGLGVAVAVVVTGAVLVRKTVRNLRDGRAGWHPALAQTQTRLNGVQRPAVDAPHRPAVEAPKVAALPAARYQSLAELGGAILAVRDDRSLAAVKQAGHDAWDQRERR